jgi:magnesium-transporting ATPase (P-type)
MSAMNDQPQVTARDPDQHRRHRPVWVNRMLVGAVVGVILIIAVLIGMAVVPRWWAQRIGDQVDSSQVSGTGIGLFYGTVFTLLPLFALRFMLRRHKHWKFRVSMLALAALLALPNLFTLGIVIGNGNAAHAGERILDVKGPNFRAASLGGAILAVLVFLAVTYLLFARHRAKGREADLRGQLKERDERQKETPPSSA